MTGNENALPAFTRWIPIRQDHIRMTDNENERSPLSGGLSVKDGCGTRRSFPGMQNEEVDNLDPDCHR